MMYLGGRVTGPRAHAEKRQGRSQSKENRDAALWHPVIEPKRVSEHKSIK